MSLTNIPFARFFGLFSFQEVSLKCQSVIFKHFSDLFPLGSKFQVRYTFVKNPLDAHLAGRKIFRKMQQINVDGALHLGAIVMIKVVYDFCKAMLLQIHNDQLVGKETFK